MDRWIGMGLRAVAARKLAFGLIGAGAVLASLPSTTFAQLCVGFTPNGAASCYLIGTYDLREDAVTTLHIINPTGHSVPVYAFFFDDSEKPLACLRSNLSANDLWEIQVNKLGLRPKAGFGVVKVITFFNGPVALQGIVGNQRISFGAPGVSETGLHPVQPDLIREDYSKVLSALVPGCKSM